MSRLDATLARLLEWDVGLCLKCNRMIRIRVLLQFFRCISWLGNGIFWYGLMLALLLADRMAAIAPVVHMTATGLACTLAYKLLKQGTLRPRPYQVEQHIAAGAQPLDQFSFPSGHTLHAVGFTVVACAYYPGLVYLTLPFTLLTAASRLVLGLHYPSDVLAGGALGALIALLFLA